MRKTSKFLPKFLFSEYLNSEQAPLMPSRNSVKLWQRAYWRVKSNIMYTRITDNYTSLTHTLRYTRRSIVPIKDSMPRLMFHPDSQYKLLWNCVLVALLIYTATITPFRVCFTESLTFSNWWWIDTSVDILFFIDIIVNINSAYINEENQLETNRLRILFRYLKTWLILDISACIPISTISEYYFDNKGGHKLIKLIRLLRLYRLFKIFRLIKAFGKSRVMISDYEEIKSSEPFSLSTTAMNLLSFSIKTLIGIHVVSCLWYFSAKIQNFSEDTWVARFGFIDYSMGDLYLRSFYWAFTTLATVGYGDIRPTNNTEIIIAISWMLFGMCFFSYTLGVLSSMLLSQNNKEIVLNNKLLAVDEFIKEEKLPKEFKMEMKEALTYSNETLGFSWADKQNIFHELPAELRYEVAIKMHSGGITNISYFMMKDKVFIAAIVPFLQNAYSNKGELIYEEGDYARDIYFVVAGHVSLTYQNIPIKSWKSGKYFGDIEVVEKTSRESSAFVAANSQLLIMGKDLVSFIHSEFPMYYNEMKVNAKVRRNRILRMKKKIDIFLRIKQSQAINNMNSEDIKNLIDQEIKSEDQHLKHSDMKPTYSRMIEVINSLDTNIEHTMKTLIKIVEKAESLKSTNTSAL